MKMLITAHTIKQLTLMKILSSLRPHFLKTAINFTVGIPMKLAQNL